MQKPIILVAFLLFASTVCSAQTVSSVFSCQGKNYSLKFTDEDVAGTPSWNPDVRGGAMLSGEKARDAAITVMNECHPEANNNWRPKANLILPMGVFKWVYLVQFDCPYHDCTNVKAVFGVYVRSDGTVIRPKPNAGEVEIPPGFRIGQNLETRDCRGLSLCGVGDYTAIIEKNPKHTMSYLNRGYAHVREKKDEEAIADFTKAIQLEPSFDQPYTHRGMAYRRLKRFDAAVSDFTKVIELKGGFAVTSAYFNRGAAYHEKGDNDNALSDYNKAITLAPNEWLYRYVRGWFHERKGDSPLADLDFQKAKELADLEENRDTVRQLGPIYPKRP